MTDKAETVESQREQEKYPYHRRFVRHKVRVKVEVQTSESYQAWTHNLSEDGVCFEIPTQLPPGREVTVWVFIHREGERPEPPVRGRCQVAWCAEGKNNNFKHGGKFLFFQADGLERLREYLEELTSQSAHS